ncbi:transposase [Paraburkholderia ginsengiterrae]|uniref:transposase n=1 Tax=Paraburkholderia ginsengiterrae TaxID=1462993 RepID=UPI002415DF97|nr:transposase [Paraburkholderia ginsengiterrae]
MTVARHASCYAISQRKRKRIEQVFGWGRTIGRIRQAMNRGCERVEQLFLLTQAAYNLTRMRTLAARAALTRKAALRRRWFHLN